MCKFIIFVVRASSPLLPQIGSKMLPLQIIFTKLGCSHILANREDEDALHAIAMRLRNQGTTATVDEYLEHIKQQSSKI